MSDPLLDAKQIVDRLEDLDEAARARWFDEHPEAAPLRAQVERILANIDRVVADAEALPDLVAPARDALVDPALPASIGRYRVLERLGAGGMGIVYLAEQDEPRRRVAVKLMRPGVMSDDAASRFRREAHLLARLQHPGIAQVVELGRLETGETFLVLEAIDGATITDHARAEGLDLAARVALLVDLADAVHHAHLRGVVHRDLKPSNVLVTRDGQVKVIDFGVARELDDDGTMLTRAGQVIGTLAYMSPEQIAGDPDAVDARADVYALGVLAYELLGERLPLDVDTASVAQAARTITEVDPPSLGRVAPSCRGDLEVVVGKALAKTPDRRYGSAAELGADLARTLRHEAILARPPTLRYQLGRLARRHRAAFAGAALAVLSLVVATVVATYYASENRALADREASAREDADRRAEEARLAAEEADRQRREVARLAEIAEGRAAEIVRRTDPARLVLAGDEAEALWPALPKTVPAMDAWLDRYVDTFTESLAAHEAALDELRAGALPYDEAQRARDLDEHPQRAELERARDAVEDALRQLAGDDPAMVGIDDEQRAIVEERLARAQADVARLEVVLAQRATWSFADPVVQEQHDHLAELVTGLRAFLDEEQGLVGEVLGRRERAVTAEARTVTDPGPAAAWRRAIDDIASLDVYGGLELEPQVGLIPMRRDPRSGLWEFWFVDDGVPAEPSSDGGDLVLAPNFDPVFVLLPGGTTTLGAQADDPGAPHFDPAATASEGPVRTVDMPPLFVSKYELTQDQYSGWTAANPSLYVNLEWSGSPERDEVISRGDARNPVEMVSFEDCVSVLSAFGLRVPTGDEWEYAARAGSATRWFTGDDVASLQGFANVADGGTQRAGGPPQWSYEAELEDDWIVHAPVGRFAPNAFGLHDVHGNVYEWTSDEPSPGLATARGGGFEQPAQAARITAREYAQRNDMARFVGVRPVRDVDGL